MAVPQEFGGHGLSLAECGRMTRQLARTLPAGAARVDHFVLSIFAWAGGVDHGFGMFKKSELDRLFRDARTGRFHPANSALTHELVAKLTLGIDPDETPRWG